MKAIRLKDGNGSAHFRATDNRSVELVEGEQPYLWIGNAESPQFCFGTIEGRDLQRLADALNDALAKARA